MITQERLKELVKYDPKTGLFFREGREIGYNNGRGYLKASLDNKEYYLHRLAWLYMTGKVPMLIDHIDRDKSNNSFENLREATASQNSHNKSKDKKNKTGVTGVFYWGARNKYVAYISIQQKRKHLGVFDTLEEAKERRRQEEETL
jgi:hypothetical protein